MKRIVINTVSLALVCALFQSTAHSQDGKNVKLHVNPKWKECSFQLDPSLTQQAWRQFTEEAGPVSYFRSLTDAKPIGAGNYEFSVLQWQTAFDDTKAAWNDTFVHPDSTHWLKDGERLSLPGLMLRAGITDRVDIGFYGTKNPEANYGIWGGQAQYSFVHDSERNWAASARLSFASLYGPDDLDLTVFGLELLASREYPVYSGWFSISPYAGVSTYWSRSHETTTAVNLQDESILGVQAMVGAVAQISVARIAVEYNVAVVSTLSFKIGIGF